MLSPPRSERRPPMPDNPWFTEADVEAAAERVYLDRFVRAHSKPSYQWNDSESDDLWRDKIRADVRAALSAIPDPRAKFQQTGRLWRHVKRGTQYQEIGRAELQAAQDVIEGCTLVIYCGMDGRLWARQEDEFEDGRFEKVSDGPVEDPRTELHKLQEEYSALESERNELSRSADAARAEGFNAAKTAISAETARRWPEAHDLLDWIADLKLEPRP